MPTGLAYLREVGMRVVNDEILRIQLPTMRESIDTGRVCDFLISLFFFTVSKVMFSMFKVSIRKAYVSKYWAPTEYSLDLSPPNMFTWSMSKMHIRLFYLL